MTHVAIRPLNNTRRHVRPRPGRRAFTLMEMMIAIGVILILLGIGVMGFRALDKNAAQRATQATLDTAAGLLTEYEATGKPAATVSGTGGAVAFGDVNTSGGDRTSAINNSETALRRLQNVPRNKDALAKLPPKAYANQLDGTRRQALADAWGNPIVLVGPNGLTVGISGQSRTEVAPGGRPFWASGGPDGNLNTGEDNLYSFRK